MEKLQDYLDVAYALVTLQAVVLVPTLARIRLVYTFLWNVFTVIATKMESPTALGLAMVMGLSVMLSWYALRFFDRSVFDSMLLGCSLHRQVHGLRRGVDGADDTRHLGVVGVLCRGRRADRQRYLPLLTATFTAIWAVASDLEQPDSPAQLRASPVERRVGLTYQYCPGSGAVVLQ
ncbi:hypothetical protein F442_16332 [Phytophthora nicotianae P10297]|uniref:Uncharacterized protein n=1 Tax=Phytophthora nicotianae P10297 TaxID=1317064 RepID=W2YMQ5_PHYNI|nr:hypothetical protein F442_16332 [Phytophthora nicotianae P10297]